MIEVAKSGVDVGIMTTNEAGQRRFYGEALGLPYLGEAPLPTGKLHVYGCGDSLLKLYVLPGLGAPAAQPFPHAGIAYFTINVVDVRSAAARLKERGAEVGEVGEFDAGVSLSPPVGRVRALFAMARDADGNAVELLQRV